MEEIVEHILQITNVDERGNILAYKILCNLAIDKVLDGYTPKQIIEYIDTLTVALDMRKVKMAQTLKGIIIGI